MTLVSEKLSVLEHCLSEKGRQAFWDTHGISGNVLSNQMRPL